MATSISADNGPPRAAVAAVAAVGPATRVLDRMLQRTENKPNTGQQKVLRVFADYFDGLAAGQRPAPPQIFLEGAGGTGKSFVFKCLEELADAANGQVIPSALTGVACTAIPTQACVRTAASLFQYGFKPGAKTPLTDKQVVAAQAYGLN